jgi:hypothetical protein
MHPVEKYKKIAEELHAKAQHEDSLTVRAKLENMAECYVELARKTERTSWRYAKVDE